MPSDAAAQAAYDRWLAQQAQSSPCQQAAYLAGWQAALAWAAARRWEETQERIYRIWSEEVAQRRQRGE